MLASTVIEEALRRSNESVAVGFFFCDYRNLDTQATTHILGALAVQVAMQRMEAFEMLQQYYDDLHPESSLRRSPFGRRPQLPATGDGSSL